MRIPRIYSIGRGAFVLLALFFSGCEKSPAPSAAPSGDANGPSVGAPVKAESEDPDDESMTSREYIRLGMPAHDREWSAQDMAKAHEVLTALAEKGYRRLHRYKDRLSGSMFERMTSPQNLELFRNRNISINSRFALGGSYLEATNQILKLYLAGFQTNEVRDCEIVELMGSQFRTSAMLFDLVDEFTPTLDKEDPKYPIRMKGLDQMKRGLSSVVAGCLQTLTEAESYRMSVRQRLLELIQESLPSVFSKLPPGTRTETVVRLEEMLEDSELSELHPGLKDLHAKLEADPLKEPDR